VPADRALLNDVVTDAGSAYVTDSARPVLWRLPLDTDGAGAVGEPELLADLADAGADEDSFLNGIVLDDGALLVAAQGGGVLWRVEPETGTATGVDLGGLELGADGLLLRAVPEGTLLLGVTNRGESRESLTFAVTVLRLAEDRRSAELVAELPLPAEEYDVPTTIADDGDRLLVVCGQVLHPEQPRPPFLVRGLDLPR
jgi:Cu-Zn family superoxide dismutase